MSRNHVLTLAVPVAIASASACMMFSTFYSTFDLLVSAFMGILLTVFIVFAPSLMVCAGTGTITLAFFGATFGFSGNEFFRGAYYFLFGFAMAGFVQFVNAVMLKRPAEPAQATESDPGIAIVETSLQASANIPA